MNQASRSAPQSVATVQRRADGVQPAWRGLATAGQSFGLPDRLVLYAGPRSTHIHFGGVPAAVAERVPALTDLKFRLDTHAIVKLNEAPETAIAMLATDGLPGLAGRGIFKAPLQPFASASKAMSREWTTRTKADELKHKERKNRWN